MGHWLRYAWQSTDGMRRVRQLSGNVAGYIIYSSGGGSTFLTKAQNTYGWAQANLFNATTGKVSDSTISGSSFSYNQGTCIGAAFFLGDYTTCGLSASYTMNNLRARRGGFLIAFCRNTVPAAMAGDSMEFLLRLVHTCANQGGGAEHLSTLVAGEHHASVESAADLG